MGGNFGTFGHPRWMQFRAYSRDLVEPISGDDYLPVKTQK